MLPITLLAHVALLCLVAPAPNGSGQAPLWQPTQSGVSEHIYDMHFRDARRGHAVAWAFGGTPSALILSTEDAGRTWQVDHVVANAILFAVSFTDADHGFVVGQNPNTAKGLLLRTDDGGVTWTRKKFGQTFGLYDVEFPTASIGFACGWDGAIFKTVDGGNAWTKLTTPHSTTTFRRISFVDETTGFALGGLSLGPFTMVYRTTDGGATWVRTKNFGPAHGHSGLYFQSATRGFVAGNRNGAESVLRTDDGGATWTIVSQGPLNVILQTIHGHGQRICATARMGENMHFSDDGGTTWSLLPAAPGTDWILAVAVTETGVQVGGSVGQSYRWTLEPTTYCTAKVNSQGCTPTIGWAGTYPSASQPSGFDVVSSNGLDGKAGLLFYGYAGKATPYQGGYRCIQSPVRTSIQNSGGTPPCGGSFSYDFNARIASGVDPALTPGTTVYGQYWSRDPTSSFNTNTSDAIEFTICP